MASERIGPPLSLALSTQALGPFALGTSLWKALDYLRDQGGRSLFPWVRVVFDNQAPASSPVQIQLLPLPGITLFFSGIHQILTQIHVLSPGSLSLTYPRDTLLSSPAQPLTRGTVARVFGPTFGDSTGSGELWYPGLGFGFGRQGKAGSKSTSREDLVQAIHICRQEDMAGASPSAGSLEMAPAGTLVRARVLPLDDTLVLEFSQDQDSLKITLHETTCSDLLVELGPPLRTHLKEDSRMTIHRNSSPSSDHDQEGGDVQGHFWSYFHLGIDFLVEDRTQRVVKIILHSNLPSAIQFGRYESCPWVIGPEHEDQGALSVTAKAATIMSRLSDLPPATTIADSPPPPSPSPSPPPGSVLAEVKKKRSKKDGKPTSIPSLPASEPSPASYPEGPSAAPEMFDTSKGMVLDRADGWGAGVIIAPTILVAPLPSLALEVLESGDVETVMLF